MHDNKCTVGQQKKLFRGMMIFVKTLHLALKDLDISLSHVFLVLFQSIGHILIWLHFNKSLSRWSSFPNMDNVNNHKNFKTPEMTIYHLLRPNVTPFTPPIMLHSEKKATTSSAVADHGSPLALITLCSPMLFEGYFCSPLTTVSALLERFWLQGRHSWVLR